MTDMFTDETNDELDTDNGYRARRPVQRPSLTSLILPPVLELDHPLVRTPSFEHATTAMNTILNRNKIGVIDGPPGTGKTTFAQWAAERCDRPSAIAVMPQKPLPLDLLRLCITAVTGHNPAGRNKSELEAELVFALSAWQGLLILDEVQNVGVGGLTEARYIHDITRPKFPLLLVGWGAMSTIRLNQPLNDRIRTRRNFKLLHGQELFDTIDELDPRFAAVPRDLIRLANDLYAGGNLRKWIDIIETLEDWEVDVIDETAIRDAIVHIDEEFAA
jgi:AAA domain